MVRNNRPATQKYQMWLVACNWIVTFSIAWVYEYLVPCFCFKRSSHVLPRTRSFSKIVQNTFSRSWKSFSVLPCCHFGGLRSSSPRSDVTATSPLVAQFIHRIPLGGVRPEMSSVQSSSFTWYHCLARRWRRWDIPIWSNSERSWTRYVFPPKRRGLSSYTWETLKKTVTSTNITTIELEL